MYILCIQGEWAIEEAHGLRSGNRLSGAVNCSSILSPHDNCPYSLCKYPVGQSPLISQKILKRRIKDTNKDRKYTEYVAAGNHNDCRRFATVRRDRRRASIRYRDSSCRSDYKGNNGRPRPLLTKIQHSELRFPRESRKTDSLRRQKR